MGYSGGKKGKKKQELRVSKAEQLRTFLFKGHKKRQLQLLAIALRKRMQSL